MAIGRMDFYSNVLKRMVSFHILVPGDRNFSGAEADYTSKLKTLYLYHGFSNNSWEWLLGSDILRVSDKYNLAVVLPSIENSFYLDRRGTGGRYAEYVGRELVSYTRQLFPLSDRREDTYVGGISMGGFGALHTGLAYPETFSKIMALSSALIVHEIAGQKPGFQNDAADYDYYTLTFGDLDELLTSQNNPEQQLIDLLSSGRKIPELFMACGTEDFLLEKNREFREFLEKHQIPFRYQESPGNHDFVFWNQYLEPAVRWMTEK